jgi:multidrug efflux pump subunit AcrB
LPLAANAQSSAAFSVALLTAMIVRWLFSPWLRTAADISAESGAGFSSSDTDHRPSAFTSLVAALSLAAAIASAYALPSADAGTGWFAFQLRGLDPQRFGPIVAPLLTSLHVISGVDRIASTVDGDEKWRLRLEPERVEVVGIGLAEIGRAFAVARDGLTVGEIVDGDRQLTLRLRIAPDAAGASFERLLLRGESADRPAIYLRHVGVAQKISAPRELIRWNGIPAMEITASWHDVAGRAALKDFCHRIEVPRGYNVRCRMHDSPT